MRLTYSCIDDDSEEKLLVDISTLDDTDPTSVTMTAAIIVRENGDDHIYSRTIDRINLETTNALGILQIAMDELPQEALQVEHPDAQAQATVSPSLERRLKRTMRAIQGG